MGTEEARYWITRSQKYNKLKWVTDKKLLKELVDFCHLKATDSVFDVGCGTGVVANAIYSKVAHISAIDKSQAMLAKGNFNKQINYTVGDIENKHEPIFHLMLYNKIICRMVLHHLTKLKIVFKNCYKLLENNGSFIIEEGGIFNSKDRKTKRWFSDMMAVKEKRHSFTIEKIRRYFKQTGFKNIIEKVYVNENFSINDWLDHSGQSERIKRKVYELHYNAPDYIKEYYNMKIKGAEITIDSKVLLMKGYK